MKTITILAILSALTVTSCTPAAKSAANQLVQVAVDTCTEITNFVPPTSAVGSVIGLVCQGIDAAAPTATVVIDSAVWTTMKTAYLAKHGGVLPKGVSPVTVVIDAGGK